MERYVDMKDISDGRTYSRTDMVRCDSNGCKGCTLCCTTMGDTIFLDPYDCNLLCKGLGCTLDSLIGTNLTLRVVDGLVLPGILPKKDNGACGFLNEEGRCRVHAFRPGFCRLFPLGRIYNAEKRDFSYFLQTEECPYPHKTKVRVEKWIGIDDMDRYEDFIREWHFLTKDLEAVMKANPDETFCRNVGMAVLNLFYRKPYATEDFYAEFKGRVQTMREIIET